MSTNTEQILPVGRKSSYTELITETNILAADTGTLTVVVGPFDLKHAKSFGLYAKTIVTLDATVAFTLQISPVDSGDVWISTDLIVTAPTVIGPAGALVGADTVTFFKNIRARRGRIISAAVLTGTLAEVELYALRVFE